MVFLENWFDIITDFLNFRKQRVVLNGQYSSWTSIEGGVPQGSILGRLLFFIYINDLYDGLTTKVKLFTDDTSLFSIIVHNMNTSVINLDNDLNKIKNWAIQWKMKVNRDPSEQAQEVFLKRFKRKIIIKFISIATPLNKFLSKNILECILMLN